MTVQVTDKRKVDKATSKPVEPPWWPVLVGIEQERQRQLEKWGEQHWPDGTGHGTYDRWAAEYKRINDARAKKGTAQWDKILLEEVFEALAETDPEKLAYELVQVAAVAVAWVEDINSRG